MDVEVVYSQEETPMGTAGPLALAKEHLGAGGSPFFVLNADVTCTFPFKDMLAFHRAHGKEGTIMVTKVEVRMSIIVCVCGVCFDAATL